MPVKPPSLGMPVCAAPKLRTDCARVRHDERREGSAKRGYNARWRKARETFLAREPLCWMCRARGRLVAANVVDHWFPHKGDSAVFWDTAHWAALCKHCHDGPKQALESRGYTALKTEFERISKS